jgi:hypothetical protein
MPAILPVAYSLGKKSEILFEKSEILFVGPPNTVGQSFQMLVLGDPVGVATRHEENL